MPADATAVETDGDLSGRSANEAIPRLVERLGDKMFSFGLKFCGNREDAEDLVQETFAQAYRKWDQFEGRSEVSSWLYTMAARRCQRRTRRRAGQPTRMLSLDEQLPSGDALVDSVRSADGGPLDERLRREAAEIVDRAIVELPVKFRLPLVLKEIAELSLSEIAAILGVKEATVKTRVHRGRMALRAAIEACTGGKPCGPAEHPRRVCLDLLQAKMEALDRKVEFAVPEEELCERCRGVVDGLDLAVEACRWIRGGKLEDAVRRRLVQEFEQPPG